MVETKIIVDEGIILEQKTKLSHDGFTVYYNPPINKFVAEKGTEHIESESLTEIWFLTGGWLLNAKKAGKMDNLTASTFKAHIKMKESQTKQERAKFLYGSYTFDCSLPQHWVDYAGQALKCQDTDIIDICPHFVWLYLGNDHFGQPAPLNLKGCEILERLEEIERVSK